MARASNSLRSLGQLELEIKLAHLELVPVSEGNVILPEHIRQSLHNARFVKKSDQPLLAYGLFCLDSNNQLFCFDAKVRKRVLDRVAKSEAKHNAQVGRVLVRGYFETLVNATNLSWSREFAEEVKKVILIHSDNQFLVDLFDKTVDQLAESYDGHGFNRFLRRLGGGCLNESSDFCIQIWQATIPKILGRLHAVSFRPNLDELLPEIVEFLFFEEEQKLREIEGCLEVLRSFVQLLHSSFRAPLTLTQKGMLLDLAGWLYKDNLRLNSLELHELQEKIRELASA